MAEKTAKRRLLENAEKLLGRSELAAGLKVSEALVEAWIAGVAEMPDRRLLLLAELLEKFAEKQTKSSGKS